MIQIYCGDGKGKTTAAVGLAVRAAGHQIPVFFVQFMKNEYSGEIYVLKNLPMIEVHHAKRFYGFTKNMNQEQKEEMKKQYQNLLKQTWEAMRQAGDQKNVVILDEVIHACNQKLLDEKELYRIISECPKNTEIILTGRNPSQALLERADYISEIKKVKHPYDRGISARKGIEL